MASIREYHRPGSVDEALALLGRDEVMSVLVGGGTVVVADQSAVPVQVVDLQALGLDGIEALGGRVRIGATTRLQDVVDAESVPPLIRDAAKREAPNTIRNMATVGGTVAAADPDSGLLAALLVHGAVAVLASPDGSSEMELSDLLADRTTLAGKVIAAVVVDTGGETSWAGTGRTPADTPIVAAYARAAQGQASLALTGVAATPLLVDPGDVAALVPAGDFRGSSEYRQSLAAVLAGRVLDSLGVAP